MNTSFVTEAVGHGWGSTRSGNQIDRRTHAVTEQTMDQLVNRLQERKNELRSFPAQVALSALADILKQHFPKLRAELVVTAGMSKIPIRFYKQQGNGAAEKYTPCGFLELQISGHVTLAEVLQHASTLPLLRQDSQNLR